VPRPRRILETALYSDDAPRLVAFYRDLLQTEPMLATDRLTAFDAGQATILLIFARGQTEVPLDLPIGRIPGHGGSASGHVAFAIDAEDLAVWQTRLAELGIAVESTIRWERGGVSLYFRDPDGRSVELVTPGLWASY